MEAQIGKRGQLSFSFRFFPLLSVSFRSFPFLSVLLFLTVLASCRERPTAQTSFDPETYVVLTKGGYDSLDPAWAYDSKQNPKNQGWKKCRNRQFRRRRKKRPNGV